MIVLNPARRTARCAIKPVLAVNGKRRSQTFNVRLCSCLVFTLLFALGRSWVLSWTVLGALGALLGALGCSLGPSWAVLGTLGTLLGRLAVRMHVWFVCVFVCVCACVRFLGRSRALCKNNPKISLFCGHTHAESSN